MKATQGKYFKMNGRFLTTFLIVVLATPFLTRAGANVWTRLCAEGDQVASIAVDPGNPMKILAGISFGEKSFIKSTDGGRTWSGIGLPGNSWHVNAIAFDPSNTSIVYAGGDVGMFKSVDGGNNWTLKVLGLSNNTVTALAIDPFNGSVLYAGTMFHGILKSVDGGDSWTSTDVKEMNVDRIEIDPKNSSIVYAATPFGIYRSADSGNSWNLMIEAVVTELAVDPETTSTIYIAIMYGGGIFKSKDSGRSWVAMNEGFPHNVSNICPTALVIDSLDPERLYTSILLVGAYRSDDGAENWQKADEGLTTSTVLNFAIDRAIPPTVYAGTDSGIFSYTVMECPAVTLEPDVLPIATKGIAYSQTFSSAGGEGPYTYVASSGWLPEGFELDSSTGLLSGIPATVGDFSFWIQSTDFHACSGTRHYELKVVPDPPVITAIDVLKSPLRLKILGEKFHQDCVVRITSDGLTTEVPVTLFKSETKLIAKGGSALKALLPKGVAVQVTVLNSDDNGVSSPVTFVR